MKIDAFVKPALRTLPFYEPGRPIETVAREYGLNPEEIIKLASNENPLGPSPLGMAAAQTALSQAHFYPDGSGYRLCRKLAEHHHLTPEQFILGNGSNEIMVLLAQALLGPGDEVVMGESAFPVYRLVTLMMGATPVMVPMPDHRHDLNAMAAAVTPRTKILFLPSPNNPTGTANTEQEIVRLAESLPDHVLFCFDEAYAEYLDQPPSVHGLIAAGYPVLALRTFSKIYGLAALRIGYGYGPAPLIAALQRLRQPFNTNAIAQTAACAALDDADHIQRGRDTNDAGLRQLENGLTALGIDFVPSVANFLLAAVPDAPAFFHWLQARGIIVRPMGGKLAGYVRVSVGTTTQNQRFLDALNLYLANERQAAAPS